MMTLIDGKSKDESVSPSHHGLSVKENANDAGLPKQSADKEKFNTDRRMESKAGLEKSISGNCNITAKSSEESFVEGTNGFELQHDDAKNNLNRDDIRINGNLKELAKGLKHLHLGNDKITLPEVKNGNHRCPVEQLTVGMNKLLLESGKTKEQELPKSKTKEQELPRNKQSSVKETVPQKDQSQLTVVKPLADHDLSRIPMRWAEEAEQNLAAENEISGTVEILAVPGRIGEENEDPEDTCVISGDMANDPNRCMSFVGRGPIGGKPSGYECFSEIMNKGSQRDSGQSRKFSRVSESGTVNYNRHLSGGSVQVVNCGELPNDINCMPQYPGFDMYMPNGPYIPGYNLLPPGFSDTTNFEGGQQLFLNYQPYFTNSHDSRSLLPAQDFSDTNGMMPTEYSDWAAHQLGNYEHFSDDVHTGLNPEEMKLYPTVCQSPEQGMTPLQETAQCYRNQIQSSPQRSQVLSPQSLYTSAMNMASPAYSPLSVSSYPYSPTPSVLTAGDPDFTDMHAFSPSQLSLSSPESGICTDYDDDLGLAIEALKEVIEESEKYGQNSLKNFVPLVEEVGAFGENVPPVPTLVTSCTFSDTIADATPLDSGCKYPAKNARAHKPNKTTGNVNPKVKARSKGTINNSTASSSVERSILPPVLPQSFNFIYQQQVINSVSNDCPRPQRFIPIMPKQPDSCLQNSTARQTKVAAGSLSSARRFSPPLVTLPAEVPCDEDQRVRSYRMVAGFTKAQLLNQDDDGDTILHLAIVKEEILLVKALLSRYDRDKLIDKVVNLANKQHQTPLCLAVFLNQTEVVKMLIERKADVNVQLQKKLNGGLKCYRLIHYASCRGQKWVPTLIEMLKSENIDLRACNSEGCTALHCAMENHGLMCQQGAEKLDSKATIYQLAIHSGVDLNIQHGLSGKTPLHYAIEKKDSDLVRWFLDLVGYLQSVNGNLSPDLMRSLLNAKTSAGVTSLQLALGLSMDQVERVRILELLLQHGAEVSQRSSDGKWRQDLAKIPELAPYLRK